MGLIVLRHPPVTAPGLCYGRYDPPLSADAPEAIAAAVRAVHALESSFSALLSSPATRCITLADALGTALNMTVTTDKRLAELDFGAWEGRPWSEIPRHESDPWAEDPVTCGPPGGESFAKLTDRVRTVLSAQDGALVITHGGPIRALRILAGQATFDTAFAEPVAYATPLFLPTPR